MGSGWTFDRPWVMGLAPLLLVAWWWLARTPRPVWRYTGAYRFWTPAGKHDRGAARRRRWPQPFALWLALLALWGAWLGPQPPVRGAEPAWRVLVDESASMELPHESGSSRGAVALALWERERGARNSRYERWLDGRWVTMDAAPPWAPVSTPRARFDPPQAPDEPGVVWLTDDAPAGWQHGSWIAAGGQAVPGPVLLWGDEQWVASPGEPLRREPAPTQWVRLGSPETSSASQGVWPTEWQRLVALWAAERGLQVWEQDDAPQDGFVALELVVGPLEGPLESARVDGGGFRVQGQRPADGPTPAGAFALPASQAGGAVLAIEPGRLRLLWTALEVQGDRALWARELAMACDAARMLPPSVIPESERAAARGGVHWGSPPVRDASHSPAPPWTPWLAILGALSIWIAWPAFRRTA